MKNSVPREVATLLACLPMLAIGQAPQRTEPGALPSPSAFTTYQAYRDIAPGDWRGLNDTVGAAALKSGAPPARPAMPVPSAAPMPHDRHRGSHDHPMHGGRP
ncbi:MAG: hypothetical protein J0M20_12425 [Burkholderiales bacterium]|nr:hypothetical protein [Burkholderiales bacterium]